MSPPDELMSKTLDDFKNVKTDGQGPSHLMADLYDLKSRDGNNSHNSIGWIMDTKKINENLHAQGMLPGVTIVDAAEDSVVVVGKNGRRQTLDAEDFGKLLGVGDNSKAAQPGQVSHDAQGRVTDITSSDGSTTQVTYDGDDKNPNKITTTNKDGSTDTFEKSGNRWTETTTKDGTTNTKNVDLVAVNDAGLTVIYQESPPPQTTPVNGSHDLATTLSKWREMFAHARLNSRSEH